MSVFKPATNFHPFPSWRTPPCNPHPLPSGDTQTGKTNNAWQCKRPSEARSCQWHLPSAACDSLNWWSDEKDQARLDNGCCDERHVPAPGGGTSDTNCYTRRRQYLACTGGHPRRPTLRRVSCSAAVCFMSVRGTRGIISRRSWFLSRLRRYGIWYLFWDLGSRFSSFPTHRPIRVAFGSQHGFTYFVTTESGFTLCLKRCRQLNHCRLVPLERSHRRVLTSSFPNPRITARRTRRPSGSRIEPLFLPIRPSVLRPSPSEKGVMLLRERRPPVRLKRPPLRAR